VAISAEHLLPQQVFLLLVVVLLPPKQTISIEKWRMPHEQECCRKLRRQFWCTLGALQRANGM